MVVVRELMINRTPFAIITVETDTDVRAKWKEAKQGEAAGAFAKLGFSPWASCCFLRAAVRRVRVMAIFKYGSTGLPGAVSSRLSQCECCYETEPSIVLQPVLRL